MRDTPSKLESLVQCLRAGTPRAAFIARQELIDFGSTAEVPLVQVLRESSDPYRILEALTVLEKIKMSDQTSVDSVVRLLAHKKIFVRKAAACCLLISSPKLRRVLEHIRKAAITEQDLNVRAILQKLLDRYPKNEA